MIRPLLPLLLAGALMATAVALPVALAESEKEERGREDRPSPSDDAPGRNRRGPDDEPSRLDAMRPGPSVGAFDAPPGSQAVQGRHVSFTYNETGVQDFSADGVTLFDLTVEGGSRDERRSEAEGRGSEVRVRTPTFTFKAHDNAAAVSKLQTDGVASLAFEGAARLVEASGTRVDFVVGNVSGSIRARGVDLQGQTVVLSGEALVFLHQSRGAFDKHREDLSRAIGRGHVGAEATIGRGEGQDDLVEEVVSYGNVTMTRLKAEKGNLTLLIDGHGTEGRVLVLNVDGRIIGAQKREDLTVLMDNLSIAPATDLADVLDPENDGFLPEYHVVFDPATESFQLLVSVPHYSVHVLSVMTAIPLPPPSVVLGVVAGVALLVPGAYVLFRRKEG